jgi:5-methyltetrahydrofolate--homocysteine methyltransferase
MNARDAIERVLQAVADLEIDRVAARVRDALQAGAEPRTVLNDGLSAGVQVVGERFEAGDYYLTELVLAGEVMKEGLALLEPSLKEIDLQGKGTVVLATVEGDIHDIGKNLVGTMLRAAGFEVVDLGADVPAAPIVEAARRYQAGVVALSVLLTPMVGQLQTTIEALEEAGLRSQVKVVIGGACTTPRLAEEMGCDGYGPDAVAAVRLCERLLGESRKEGM